MPPRSDTLAINDAAAPREASPIEMKHDMGGMPGMQHQNMEGMKHDTPATAPATKATSPAPVDHAAHGGKP